MFVLKSKYEVMGLRARVAELKYQLLLEEWNTLIRRINRHGGESIFSKKTGAPQFDQEELQKLIQLCHPDKHDGKKMASDMTVKLLALKEGLQKNA